MFLRTRKVSVKTASGLSMVELLVALAISAIVLIAVVNLFGQNKASYVAHENITRLQENGRYAIQVLTRELRSADYWGCIPSFQGNPSPNIEPVANNVVGLPVITSGINGIDGGAGSVAGYSELPDTLILSGVQDGRSFQLAVPTTTAEEDLIVDVGSLTDTGIEPNDILVISDCTRADIFQVTNDVDATIDGPGVDQARIRHTTVPTVTTPPTPYSNASNALTYTYGTLATVYKGVAANRRYFIQDDDHDGDAATAAIPSLMLDTGCGAACTTALVPGVENMQIVYGQDTSVPRDGQADRYVNATDADPNWEDVVSARISLLVRSPDARNQIATGYTMEGQTVANTSIPALDGKFHNRKVYTTTVTLRNRSS